jgi:large repetitive protein
VIGTQLADLDGSEVTTVTVAGVPAGAAFSAGTNLGGGSWSFTAAQLSGLNFLPAVGFTGNVNLSVTATATAEVGPGAEGCASRHPGNGDGRHL